MSLLLLVTPYVFGAAKVAAVGGSMWGVYKFYEAAKALFFAL